VRVVFAFFGGVLARVGGLVGFAVLDGIAWLSPAWRLLRRDWWGSGFVLVGMGLVCPACPDR